MVNLGGFPIQPFRFHSQGYEQMKENLLPYSNALTSDRQKVSMKHKCKTHIAQIKVRTLEQKHGQGERQQL